MDLQISMLPFFAGIVQSSGVKAWVTRHTSVYVDGWTSGAYWRGMRAGIRTRRGRRRKGGATRRARDVGTLANRRLALPGRPFARALRVNGRRRRTRDRGNGSGDSRS